uniref:HTH_Tnp_Tc3_1 domain-containing protein n=1 Tax=Heterorhabditis bacteriophora TaxID=37862 RepID=A0A1I7WFZ9_HETBA
MALHQTVKQYQELGLAKDRFRSGRPRSVNTSRVRKNVKRILRGSKRPMNKMTSDLNISPTLIRTIVKHKLRFYLYKIRTRPT